VLNAIANQLRYPNRHTYYFSCLLLFLFASNKQKDEQLQEQIARVLLERLLVSRPYPWGILVTFIELIKNEAYALQSSAFIHCAPEIERLFESCLAHVQQSQAPPPPIQQQQQLQAQQQQAAGQQLQSDQ
jgi:CCR4-NOT transcription complex subunit 1